MTLANTQAMLNHSVKPGPIANIYRRSSEGTEPTVLTDIYDEDVNIVRWQRNLSNTLRASVKQFLIDQPHFKTAMTVSPQSVYSSVSQALGSQDMHDLAENIAELVDMYCCLFELKRTGLRLTALDKAMCPRFHVDKTPCRLITTYQGIATQWLSQQHVDRSKLGAGNNGLDDDISGLYQNESDIQQLNCADVGLLKGEYWFENEQAGLVHRSPAVSNNQTRLLLTLDFSD